MSSSSYRTCFVITIENKDSDGCMTYDFEEALVTVGRLIERLNRRDKFIGKYIYVVKYDITDDEIFVKRDDLFDKRYLIEK